MDEIVIPFGLRERLQDLGARRRDAWPLLLFLGALALLAIVVGGGDAPAQVAPPAMATATSPSADPADTVLVHVAGAVRDPDLYEFPAGARVADAIDTAGGPMAKADLDALNLAELLIDGGQVLVPKRGEQPVASGTSSVAPGAPAPVALNSADQAQLETIPGIGPVTALAILELRDRIGGFESLDQLLDVDGIGPATLDDMRSYLTL